MLNKKEVESINWCPSEKTGRLLHYSNIFVYKITKWYFEFNSLKIVLKKVYLPETIVVKKIKANKSNIGTLF